MTNSEESDMKRENILNPASPDMSKKTRHVFSQAQYYKTIITLSSESTLWLSTKTL